MVCYAIASACDINASVASFWQRSHKIRHGARGDGSICASAPGLVNTYIVWSDRPLFLWPASFGEALLTLMTSLPKLHQPSKIQNGIAKCKPYEEEA
ncbi:hypothetical protein BV372_33715 [Nostoc sp. T09]|nr:hypothetical protein BV372_33715 [Nostoc sp. T09]